MLLGKPRRYAQDVYDSMRLLASTQSIIMIVNIGAIMLHGVFMRFVLLSQWTILFSHIVNTECI